MLNRNFNFKLVVSVGFVVVVVVVSVGFVVVVVVVIILIVADFVGFLLLN